MDGDSCVMFGCVDNDNGICRKCRDGFRLNDGRCLIDGCVYYADDGCQVCQNGMVAGTWGCRKAEDKVCVLCNLD